MTDPRIEELRKALDDPRMTQEFYVIGQGVIAVWEKLEALVEKLGSS